ncbi:MAG: ribulose-phosphate 3-epimerase [Armatimonadetes bacterium]|nr:ribulose-phosphate 3-epimerase [Armatimonadota bacterium]
MSAGIKLLLGVKTDPIEYRYSFPWLFRLAAEEGAEYIQLGSTFEFYLLPDEFFRWLREQAERTGVKIYSLFTAHRELGGFFRHEPGWEGVARRMFERYIQIGGILGARSVGHNPGAVLRDEMHTKPEGVARYLRHFKELMHFAHEQGVEWLTIEPMSCLAEPPTLPDEIRQMGEELTAYHRRHPDNTARMGFCVDVSHGYADVKGNVVWDHLQTFEAALPYLYEVHLKNTDSLFHSTFGFGAEEREKGIVKVERFRDLLHANSHLLPVREVVGYLEISGPKLGRDYSDILLENQLRESLRHLRETWCAPPQATEAPHRTNLSSIYPVRLCASLMCADLLNLEAHVRQLEAMGIDYLHFDLMDAHFTPNMPMGLEVIAQLRRRTALPFDVHLMVEDNDLFIRKLLPIGVEAVSVHAESALHLDRTLSLIREGGAKAGVALNPATPLDVLEYVLEKLDFELVMTVNPGFAGQRLIPQTLRKVADCRRYLDERGFSHVPIQVDGNVSFENIPKMVAIGADWLVLGSSSLYHPDETLWRNHQQVLQAVREGLRQRAGGLA